jgi:hypothetical protein
MDTILSFQLNELRSLLRGRTGPVSLLAGLPPLSLRAEEAQSTARPGSGDVTLVSRRPGKASETPSPLVQALEAITRSEALKKVTTARPDGSLRFHLLYSAPGLKPQGLLVDENDLARLCDEAQWLDSLLPNFPDSAPVSNVAFTQSLPPPDAFVLAALLDETGAAADHPAGGIAIQSIAARLADLQQLLARNASRAATFSPVTSLLAGILPFSDADVDGINASLGRLNSTGLACPAPAGWQLTPQAADFAGGSASASRAVFASSLGLVDGALASEELLLLPAGKGYLAFATDPKAGDRVVVTGCTRLAAEPFLKTFFGRSLESPAAPTPQPLQPSPEVSAQGTLPVESPASQRKLPRRVWLLLALAVFSLCIACSGCALLVWGLTRK